MATIATDGATFVCPHTGTASVSASVSTLQVDTVDVIVASDVIGSTISSCTWTGGVNVPCTSVVALVSGASIITKKGGAFVILNGATFSTNGNGGSPPLLTVTETQTKLTST